MDRKFKTKWLKLLRSGDIPQARAVLCNGEALCCIGVGYLAKEGRKPGASTYTENASIAIGLTDEQSRRLVSMNDSRRWGFPAIANWIEKNL